MKISEHVQKYCTRDFTEILPRSERRLREYGQSDDWRVPAGDTSTFGHFVFGEFGQNRSGRTPLSFCSKAERNALRVTSRIRARRAARRRNGAGWVKDFLLNVGVERRNFLKLSTTETRLGKDRPLAETWVKKRTAGSLIRTASERKEVSCGGNFFAPTSPLAGWFQGSGRICTRCGVREVYQDIKTMDFCEECLWDLIKDDQEP